ncbi:MULTISPECIES: PPE family protein [Mycobacterium]|uniref:PPE family protein n=1 Tax=Mycobacterium TaxID=1763 RepID=UPI000252A3F3|nr:MULTISPECIES: PPE family protein [Mycobacterium]AFC54834.1 PPE family protein [Mycobacterium paraintracellulare]OSC19888.1 PPE family protein [Mycobacterium paraintracellulare]PBA56282.1 PPE family protein [Mycobacterium intracellulare subsp. chimaera]UEB26703.1 PPE family protein [Mycobacterium intracellulare]WRU80647.1 PPE family protein [Mycobacterium sp. 5-140-3-2]
MTMPIWAAFPPEVNSAALTTGPGPASLLNSETAWLNLSAEYDTAATELSELLAEVQAGTWQGPTAEKFVAAHVPYLAWLLQNSANATAAALEHDTVIAAYNAAVAAMPTLAEIAANKALNASLIATNFLGVNTIPIAQNEFEYLQMWLRAATAMAMYEAVSQTAMTWVPPTAPPPPIQLANPPNQDAGGGANQLSWWVDRVQMVAQELTTDLNQPGSNPSTAIHSLLTDPLLLKVPHWAGESLYTFIPQVPQLTQLSVGLIVPFLPVAGAAGLAGLAGLAGVAPPAPTLPGAAAAPAPSHTGAPVAMAPGLSAPAPAATPAAAPAPAPAATPASAAAPAAPPATAVAGFDYPYVVGPPGIGAGANLPAGARSQQRSAEPGTAAAAIAPARREQARRRRRQRPGLIDPGRRHEYLDADPEPDAAGKTTATASDRGAGPLGFAGTARGPDAAPVGLTTIGADSLDDGPRMPLLPSSWGPESEGAEPGQTDAP